MDIEKMFSEQIQSMDLDTIVVDVIRELINEDLSRIIKEYTKSKVQKMIDKEIEFLLSKPIQTDDGWGKINNYGSFEELFKKTFASAFNSQYDVKRVIENQIKNKVADLWKMEKNTIAQKIANSLLESIDIK